FRGLFSNEGGDAVSAVKDGAARGDVGDRVDEDDALRPEPVDDRAVVDDFVVDVDGRAEQGEGPLEAFDRHVDAGTKPAGVGQDDLHAESPPRRYYRGHFAMPTEGGEK